MAARKNTDKPVIDKIYKLEKYPGKGGWTYTVLDPFPHKRNKGNWVKVYGTIDDFEIKQYKLMPMAAGTLFLPVRAEIRKKIRKQAGDKVHVVLYLDESELEIPEEFMLCLKEEPEALHTFNKISESEQRLYLVWIYEAKREETRADRIVKSLDRLSRGLKLYEKG